jgi:3-oxoacyl-[acyl-carrier-protein] synthase-1
VASVRAGISVYADSPVANKRAEPMTMALIPDDILPPLNDDLAEVNKLTSRQARMLRLADLALPEALEHLPEDYEQPLPLLLAGPQPRPDRARVVDGSFLSHLVKQTGTDFDRRETRLYPSGRAGGMQALDGALQILSSGQHEYVLLGGVDSYLDLFLLATLDSEDRVLANGVMDGFAPGEGAAFLLLCSDKARESLPQKPGIKICSPGIAEEQGHRHSEETYTGDGLSEAVATALEAVNNGPVPTILSSMNGESFGTKEWGVALTRNTAAIDPRLHFEHPAECYGDAGAASMPILTGLAAAGLTNGKIKGPAMVCCSSEGPQRGAVCITAEN